MDDKTTPFDALIEIKRLLLNKTGEPPLTEEQHAEQQRKIAALKSQLSPQEQEQLEALRKQRAASNEL